MQEADVAWLLDADEKDGMELAFGSLNARTRDYARFGWLYLNQGRSPLDGAQIVPEAWVRDSTTPDAPHLQPGRHDLHDYPFGYGYQWWIPEPTKSLTLAGQVIKKEFMALGIYGQSIYINVDDNVVVARNAAWPNFKDGAIASFEETVGLSRAIAVHFHKSA
jgi:CubicO group peptidase (beta-lactamase class C family)